MAISSTSRKSSRRINLWHVALITVIILLGLYVVVRNWDTVLASLRVARTAQPFWLFLGLSGMAFTYFVVAGIYAVLALHPLRYTQTALVELSSSFVNRLLPSGIGNLGLHGVYLYKRGHSAAEATAVVSISSLLSFAGHIALLLCAGIFYREAYKELAAHYHVSVPWVVVVGGLTAVIVVLCLPAVRRRINSFIDNLVASLGRISRQGIGTGLGLAMLLTATYTAILWASAHAIGLSLNLVQAFVVLSISVLTSAVTPTPGGLVGAEAGLFAGFIAYGADTTTAGAAVVIYRLVTYWLPMLPGAIALLIARQRRIV